MGLEYKISKDVRISQSITPAKPTQFRVLRFAGCTELCKFTSVALRRKVRHAFMSTASPWHVCGFSLPLGLNHDVILFFQPWLANIVAPPIRSPTVLSWHGLAGPQRHAEWLEPRAQLGNIPQLTPKNISQATRNERRTNP